MPDTRHPTTEAPETVHRMVRLRLYPGDAAMSGTTCWPTRSGVIACGRPTGSAPSPFRPSSPWAGGSRNCATTRTDYPFACVRYSLKYLADAYQRYFKDPQ
ncbi:MAG: hypothetical protein J4G06_02750, partial [Caldilineaceae bacterium]|nr:hypothetical protein [Caldilineaceae bacterium]